MRWPARSDALLCICTSLAVVSFVSHLLGREPYDDSYFFKRVIVNWVDGGSLAWNLDEGPVYGLTSQTWQWVAWFAVHVSRSYFVLIVRACATVCVLASYWVLLRLSRALDGGMAATYTICSPIILYMTISGMETPLAVLLIAGILWSIYGADSELSRRPGKFDLMQPAVAPLLTVLLYATRPDAVALVLPALLVEHYVAQKTVPWREGALVFGGIAACWALFKWAYGTALPLPFYAKSALFSPYDAHFLALSREVQRIRFGAFFATALPLALTALLRRDRVNWTLLGSVLAFEGYHLWSTVEVMGMQGRFYAPALPLLAFAAARALGLAPAKAAEQPRLQRFWLYARLPLYLCIVLGLYFAHFIPTADDWFMDQVALPLLVTCLVFGVALCWPTPFVIRKPGPAALLALLSAGAACTIGTPELLNDEQLLQRHSNNVTTYRGLEPLVACLGSKLHVYHSEVGVVGLRFQDGKVTDLAGLLSPRWLFRGSKSFDELCLEDRPEAIFLPHKNYVALNREIRKSRCLRGYTRVVERSSSPLYVRKDLLPKYRECAPK